MGSTIKLPQASLFGRIGEAFGSGLGEQLPKEYERSRLSKGLQELSDKKDLTPFQKFAGLVSLPGSNYQIVQSGGKLLSQEGISQGFKNMRSNSPSDNPFKENIKTGVKEGIQDSKSGLKQSTQGLVTPENTQAALENYIPKTLAQLQARAGELYEQNRALYPNPEDALKAASQEDQQNQSISNARQGNRNSQIGVEDRLRGQLQGLRKAANAGLPDNVYQQVENDVIDKVSNGTSELEAAKEGQKKLDQISREYNTFNSIDNWTLPFKKPDQTKRAIFSLRDAFKKRNDLENFADSLVGKNGISPSKAYYLAYPVKDQKDLNSYIKGLPSISEKLTHPIYYSKDLTEKTKKIAPDLAKYMGKEGSPLSIAEELRQKGYDPEIWLNYLTQNKRELDLTERQGRELEKPKNWFPSLNDLWLFIGGGMSNVVED